jgi:hypothetical protein
MKKILTLPTLLFLSLLSSCVYEQFLETVPTTGISVLTRSNVEEMSGLLPVHIYAFASDGKCAGYQMLSEPDEPLFLTLPIGYYTFYALAGASTDRYNFPDLQTVSASSLLTLCNGSTNHTELAIGRADVTLKDAGDEELTITLTRVVAQIKTVITSLPENITGVKMSFNPMKTVLCLNGTFNDEPEKKEVVFSLTKKNDTEWHTADSIHVFPSESEVTIGIELTDEDGKERKYSYNADLRIDANYKYEINAAYKTGSLDLRGIIRSTDWAGEEQINFDFGEGSSNYVGRPSYAANDFYEDCYILDVEEETEGVTLTLLSPKQYNIVYYSEGARLAAEHELNGITGWELLGTKEAALINQLCTNDLAGFNTLLEEHGVRPFLTEFDYYLCVEDGLFKLFPITGTFTLKPTSGDNDPNKKRCYVRFINKLYIAY